MVWLRWCCELCKKCRTYNHSKKELQAVTAWVKAGIADHPIRFVVKWEAWRDKRQVHHHDE
jgi:hypothetical protein